MNVEGALIPIAPMPRAAIPPAAIDVPLIDPMLELDWPFAPPLVAAPGAVFCSVGACSAATRDG